MSRLYEALRKSETEQKQKGVIDSAVSRSTEEIREIVSDPFELENTPSVQARISPESHLVAWTDPQGLAAEKFRVLMTRLVNLRSQRELKSLQVTSAGTGEGKSLVSANLAVTLARHSESRVLLVEGDLHQPALSRLFGFGELRGMSHWVSSTRVSINSYLYRMNELPLWFLPAGGPCAEPAEILQSGRLTEQFPKFAGWFDWVIVDSTPLLPMADANIWNRLADGTLLVVREGITAVKELKRGLASLDNPKLVGVVLNDASEFDRVNYYDNYYAKPKAKGDRNQQKKETVLHK